jgi:hypothetical protein
MWKAAKEAQEPAIIIASLWMDGSNAQLTEFAKSKAENTSL